MDGLSDIMELRLHLGIRGLKFASTTNLKTGPSFAEIWNTELIRYSDIKIGIVWKFDLLLKFDGLCFAGAPTKLIPTLGLPRLHIPQPSLRRDLRNVCQVETVRFEPRFRVRVRRLHDRRLRDDEWG